MTDRIIKLLIYVIDGITNVLIKIVNKLPD